MNKENFSLTFFVSNTLFSGLIYSKMFSITSQDAIISGIIGTIIGLLIIVFLSKINLSKSFKIIPLFIYIYFLILSFSTLEIFISSFLLTKTPKIIMIIPALSLGLYASFRDMKTLKEASFIFLWLSIISFLITIIFLFNYVHLENVLPLFVHKPKNLLHSSLIFGLLSSFPNILLKEENIPLKKHLKYYLITAIFNIFMIVMILGVLSPGVAKIYSYPEYMVLKRIKLLDFIENIENVSVLVWYFNYFYFISLSLKRIFSIIKNKVVFYTICISSTLVSSYIFTNNYMMSMYLYHSPLYMFILFIILLYPTRYSNNS